MSYLLPSPHTDTYSLTSSYSHTDTLALHEKNKKRYGPEWYWYDREIVYKMNKLGYRMDKEVEDVDFNNYYAFFGCSYTVGTGMRIEDTFPHIISSRSGVDYINGAVGGASPDFAFYNIVTLLTTAPKKPKMLIVNWPEVSRTCFWERNQLTFFLPNFSSKKNHWANAYKDFIMEDTHMHNRLKMYRDSLKLMCGANGIQLFEFVTYQSDDQFHSKQEGIHAVPVAHPDYDTIPLLHRNKGRDVSMNETASAHPGFLHQHNIARLFYKEMAT